jgi:hypothetical protein
MYRAFSPRIHTRPKAHGVAMGRYTTGLQPVANPPSIYFGPSALEPTHDLRPMALPWAGIPRAFSPLRTHGKGRSGSWPDHMPSRDEFQQSGPQVRDMTTHASAIGNARLSCVQGQGPGTWQPMAAPWVVNAHKDRRAEGPIHAVANDPSSSTNFAPTPIFTCLSPSARS